MVKVGLIQFAGKQDKRANLRRAEELIADAARQGAQIVSLQELANTIFFPFEESHRYFDCAEPIPGPSTEFFGDLARQHGIVLVAPIFERQGGGDYFNSAAILGPDGGLIGTYRKSSIPHIRREGQPAANFEKFYFRPGNLGFPVFPTPLDVNLGVLICFDRHFPEAFRTLALGGAHLVTVPTGSAGNTRNSRAAWFFELQAAAFQNGCWVAGVNRVGLDEGGADKAWYGSSVLISPYGEIVAQASDQEDQALVADFDPAVCDVARTTWGFFRDRRPEMYAPVAR